VSAASPAWPPGPVWVVLPTYDEAENVTAMLDALLGVLDRAGITGCLLVVDDGSPDGTAELARLVAARDGRVRVLERARKEGIGPAYRAGFAWALAEGAELVVEMDCDFSHDPARLPDLIGAARDADLVIGSRYVRGGGVARWGVVRRAVSRGGCLYARWILGAPVHDLTGGFKCFRRRVLETVPLALVTSAGYGFQIEVTFRALRQGYRVREVPIVFIERRHGRSKMSRRIVLEAALRVPALRWRLGSGGAPPVPPVGAPAPPAPPPARPADRPPAPPVRPR
jgi:dolichol-phosphate mannosyltransferase